MASFGSSSGGGSSGYSSSNPVYLPGQLRFLKKYMAPLESIYGGDYSSPTAKSMIQRTKEQAINTAAGERKQISEANTLSDPARQAMYRESTNKAMQAGTNTIPQVWSQVADTLKQYVLNAPATSSIGGQTSSGPSGFQAGICSCYIFIEAGDGYLDNEVRAFRDEHFIPGGLVDRGYKLSSYILVPMMKRCRWFKEIIRNIMITPCKKVVMWVNGDSKGWGYIPIAYGWIYLWKTLGIFSSYRKEVTPRGKHIYYPSMAKTFYNRVRGNRNG